MVCILMKVLFVTNQFPSKKFPYKVSFIFTQAKELIEQGNDIIVLTPNYGFEEKYTNFNKIFTTSLGKQLTIPLLAKMLKT